MKLLYIANIRLPTERAHGIQIMKTCEAFHELKDMEVELVIPKTYNHLGDDPFSYHNIKKPFAIHWIPIFRWYRFLKLGYFFKKYFI